MDWRYSERHWTLKECSSFTSSSVFLRVPSSLTLSSALIDSDWWIRARITRFHRFRANRRGGRLIRFCWQLDQSWLRVGSHSCVQALPSFAGVNANPNCHCAESAWWWLCPCRGSNGIGGNILTVSGVASAERPPWITIQLHLIVNLAAPLLYSSCIIYSH